MSSSASGACKGDRTRAAIIDAALCMASRLGLDGVSIGNLARDLQLSKSGLFAHFQSKENLQLEVLREAGQRFVENVVRPALAEPRGELRLRSLVDRWLGWIDTLCSGGCLFVQAAAEFDDRPGPVREELVRLQRQWMQTLVRAARVTLSEGHFHSQIDPAEFAFQVQAVLLGYHHSSRLLHDPAAGDYARRAIARLFEGARQDRSNGSIPEAEVG